MGKRYISGMAKEASRGVFWVVDGELLAFPFMDEYMEGVAKSGNTYNHKKLWPNVKPKKCNKPYNYYPRGRVEITSYGKIIVYMNPNVDDSLVPDIKRQFGLQGNVTIQYDNSAHYFSYLDDGWKADR